MESLSAPPTYVPAVQSSLSNLRVRLREIQSATRGRKFGLKDRRTVDPPPVVQLHAYRTVRDASGIYEVEVEDYSRLEVSGLICHIDLFPLPASPHAVPIPVTNAACMPSPASAMSHDEFAQPDWPMTSPNGLSEEMPVPLTVMPIQEFTGPDPVIAWVNGAPVRASDSITSDAIGARAVEAMRLRYDNKTMIVFTFSDLAIRRVGSCFFRYKAFDLRSPTTGSVAGAGSGPIAMLGDCYARCSTVIYDTKSFPGLQYSTSLSQAISNQSEGQRPRVRIPKTRQ
ncbi:hypothetical protein PUNSTDRAFT_111300 [Punctularia strigosozonata HHB-11173 SS5]|uniref:uncharacterized protein n=1 Tax=Punctularia strigosozonata (strain HHB-11173) TaxID=741275 RepID=UPI0004416488|nr:uncharacterized protein PUNSTDRAFT_111300 [Punctularia strigosozonata HHB-11173 SS5]EIN12931.1 hypothetical protein PUNSTDRAFT_111300 [Punctularia strigosozonata HHB-11173 SS5]